ncbi:MAG: M67 family metallopeptidase [Anaerolineae bacterium]|nr:M67 family metallopeptidase [Anaerolineae bacterium]
MAFWLTPQQVNDLVAQAKQGAPREICGVIGGRGASASEITPITNVATTAERAYRLDERELAHVLTSLARRGLGPVAFYHSHPGGDPRPSALDVAEWAYPDTVLLIIGLQPAPALSAWAVRWGEVTPVELVIDTEPARGAGTVWTNAAQIAILIAIIAAVALVLLIAFSLLPPAPPIPATPMPR